MNIKQRMLENRYIEIKGDCLIYWVTFTIWFGLRLEKAVALNEFNIASSVKKNICFPHIQHFPASSSLLQVICHLSVFVTRLNEEEIVKVNKHVPYVTKGYNRYLLLLLGH